MPPNPHAPMKPAPLRTPRLLFAAVFAALFATVAHAQLLISGRITGEFTDTPGANDTIYNAPDGSSAWFKSGIPYGAGSVQSAIEFSQKNFADVGSGGLIAEELFRVTNGRNLLGSTASSAHFDLWVTLTDPESHAGLLTSIAFTIENTPNNGGLVDDVFEISASSIAPFTYAGYVVQFDFVAPGTFTLHENESTPIGELYVRFIPAPEPATYGALGALVLLGLAGYRTFRRRAPEPAAA